MKEAYIYTYTNKINGKVYIGSRSAYEGKAEDDFDIKYFSSSKDKEFREAMSNGELEGMIILKIECENAGKKIVDIEAKMITAFWNKYGKEMSYNHHNNSGKFSTSGTCRVPKEEQIRKRKEYNKEYEERNKEQRNEYHKEYNKEYRERNKEQNREYMKKYMKEYREKNKEQNREYMKKYMKEYREKTKNI